MTHQVALVTINDHGMDVGLYLNGVFLTSADPGCGDSTEAVETVADNLAAIYHVEVTNILHDAGPEWQWNDIELALKDKGLLTGGLKTYRIDYEVIQEGGDRDGQAMEFQAEDFSHAVEQLIDHYRSIPDEHLVWVQPHETEGCKALYQEDDTDYHLNPIPGSTCWISVGNASVMIKRESEGVVVDIYDSQCETPLATAACTYQDCVPELEPIDAEAS